MRHGKKILSLLLVLAMLASMSVFALAEDAEILTAEAETETSEKESADTEADLVLAESESKMTVKCVDTDNNTIRDNAEDYLDLSKDQVLDSKSKRPEIEG